jgi:hypothetical protein
MGSPWVVKSRVARFNVHNSGGEKTEFYGGRPVEPALRRSGEKIPWEI